MKGEAFGIGDGLKGGVAIGGELEGGVALAQEHGFAGAVTTASMSIEPTKAAPRTSIIRTTTLRDERRPTLMARKATTG